MFNSLVREDTETDRKRKMICIIAHPNDQKHVEKVAYELITIYDYIIIHDDYKSEEYNIPNFYSHREDFLKQIDLFVVLVSENLLETRLDYKHRDIALAMSSGKHLLPILIQRPTESIFNHPISKYQMIDMGDKHYIENLEHYMTNVFDPYRDMVPYVDPFEGKVFLSYRKKDYAHALQLMHQIHAIPGFEYVHIWMDKFLIEGSRYDRDILKQIVDSDVFVLTVTNNMFTESNYVIDVEYPKALELGKPIVAIVMESVNRDLLFETFPKLHSYVTKDDREGIRDIFQELLDSKNKSISDLTPEELGELGYNYLHGENVEKNVELGLKYIQEAADKEDARSAERLGRLYYEGNLIEQDLYQAVHYLRISHAKTIKYFNGELEGKGDKAFYGLSVGNTSLLLIDIHHSMGHQEAENQMINYYFQISKSMREMMSAKVNIGYAYFLKGRLLYKQDKFNEALRYFDKSEKLLRIHINMPVGKFNLAAMLHQRALVYDKLSTIEHSLEKRVWSLKQFNEAFTLYKDMNDPREPIYQTMTKLINDFMSAAIVLDLMGEHELLLTYYPLLFDHIHYLMDRHSDISLNIHTATLSTTLAVIGRDVPDKELLEYALFHTEKSLKGQPDNASIQTFKDQLIDRLIAWPKNIG